MPPEYQVVISFVDGSTEVFDAAQYDVRTSPEEHFILVLDTEHILSDSVSVMSIPREQIKMVCVVEKP